MFRERVTTRRMIGAIHHLTPSTATRGVVGILYRQRNARARVPKRTAQNRRPKCGRLPSLEIGVCVYVSSRLLLTWLSAVLRPALQGKGAEATQGFCDQMRLKYPARDWRWQNVARWCERRRPASVAVAVAAAASSASTTSYVNLSSATTTTTAPPPTTVSDASPPSPRASMQTITHASTQKITTRKIIHTSTLNIIRSFEAQSSTAPTSDDINVTNDDTDVHPKKRRKFDSDGGDCTPDGGASPSDEEAHPPLVAGPSPPPAADDTTPGPSDARDFDSTTGRRYGPIFDWARRARIHQENVADHHADRDRLIKLIAAISARESQLRRDAQALQARWNAVIRSPLASPAAS